MKHVASDDYEMPSGKNNITDDVLSKTVAELSKKGYNYEAKHAANRTRTGMDRLLSFVTNCDCS